MQQSFQQWFAYFMSKRYSYKDLSLSPVNGNADTSLGVGNLSRVDDDLSSDGGPSIASAAPSAVGSTFTRPVLELSAVQVATPRTALTMQKVLELTPCGGIVAGQFRDGSSAKAGVSSVWWRLSCLFAAFGFTLVALSILPEDAFELSFTGGRRTLTRCDRCPVCARVGSLA
jgi:hypothetical protein